MKKINCFFVSLVLFLTSCNDILEVEPTSYTQYPANGSFSLSEASALLIGCYASMQDPITYEWALTEIVSDNTFNNFTGTSDLRRLTAIDNDTFDWQANDLNYLYPYWATTYTSIRSTNVLLNGIGYTYNATSGTLSFAQKEVVEASAKPLAAEACFIRAYNYFNLVRIYGEVPLVTVNFINPRDAFSVGKSPVSEIYKLIIADLQFAATNGLTTAYSSTSVNLGKANRYAAQALLAKVYLTLGQKTNALPLLQNIITNGGYSLQTSFTNVFSVANEMNSEIIFAIRYGNGSNQAVGNAWQENFQTRSTPLPRGDNGIAPSLFNAFATISSTSDARRNVSIRRNTSFVPTRYELEKYFGSVSIRSTGLRDWPVLRYSDVLLMYAEAAGNIPQSITYMDLVRKRSWSASPSLATLINASNPFEKVLLNERRLEFIGENQRWFDLLRFSQHSNAGGTINVKTIMKNYFTDAYTLYYGPDLGVPLTTYHTNIDASTLVLPIPASEGLN